MSEAESEAASSQDLIVEVEALESELDKKILKKDKYKKLWAEEREKNETLKKKHADQVQEKEAEIARLKKRIRELPSDWDLKLRALEVSVVFFLAVILFKVSKAWQIVDLLELLKNYNPGKD